MDKCNMFRKGLKRRIKPFREKYYHINLLQFFDAVTELVTNIDAVILSGSTRQDLSTDMFKETKLS